MFTKCEAVHQPAQPVLSIRSRTSIQSLPQLIGEACNRIFGYLGELNENPAGDLFTAYYNLDMENLDVEIGFPVARLLAGKEEIQSRMIPEGRVATCLYTGPYEKMEPAYAAITEWIKANGYEATGIVYEYYLNGPGDTTPEGYQTRIVFPLKEI